MPDSPGFRWFFLDQSVCHNVGLTRMVFDVTVVVVQEFNPAALMHVQLLLVKYVLETLVIGVNCATRTIKVMSPNLESKHHRLQFQIMGRLVSLINLQLRRGISNNFLALHQHTTETVDWGITVDYKVICTLRQRQDRRWIELLLQ